VPAYVIAHNRVLERIAAAKPRTIDELLAVDGVGQAKVRRYGDELLETVRRHEDASG
jgi:ATP-dependent DNA helicase RecQ